MPPVHRPSRCLICLFILDKHGKFSFTDNSFQILCKTFSHLNMILPKSAQSSIRAKTKIQFCMGCMDILNEIDDVYSEIDLLRNKISYLKTQLQSKVNRSRTLCAEKKKDKNIARNDEYMEMIRDLITGLFVDLPRLTSEMIDKGKRNTEQVIEQSLSTTNLEIVDISSSNNIPETFLEEASTKHLPQVKTAFDSTSFVIPAWELEKWCSTNISSSSPSLNNNNDDQIKHANFIFDEAVNYANLGQHVEMEQSILTHSKDDDERDPDYIFLPGNLEPSESVRKRKTRQSPAIAEDATTMEMDEDESYQGRGKNRQRDTEDKPQRRRVRKSAESEGKAPRDKLKVDITPDGKLVYKGFEILQTEGGFRCSICLEKKLFKLRISAVLHIMKNHMDCKRFSCDICSKQFLHLSNLKNHQKVHTTEKSLMCDVCGKVFKLRETLLGHRKTHSNVEVKKFSCQYCDKSFLHQRDCTVHMRTHTKERPFQCHICPKSFIVLTLLNRHLQSHQ